jgi:cell division septation protein DedD
MMNKFKRRNSGRPIVAKRPISRRPSRPVKCVTRVFNCRKVRKIRCEAPKVPPKRWITEMRKEGDCIKEYSCLAVAQNRKCTRLRGSKFCEGSKKRTCKFLRTISCTNTEIYQDRQEENCVNRYKCMRKQICDKAKRCKYMVSKCKFFKKVSCDEKIVAQPPVVVEQPVEQPEEGPNPEDRPNPTEVEDPKPTDRPEAETKPEPEPEPQPQPEPEPEPQPVEEERPLPPPRPQQFIPVPPPMPIPMPSDDNSNLLLATQLAGVRMQLTALLPGLLQQLKEKKSCCAQRSPCCQAPLVHHESGRPYRHVMRKLERKLRNLTRRQQRRATERRRFARQRRLTRRVGDNLEEEIYRN